MVLLKVLRKTREREKEMRILMLGLDNAGKTTVVKRMNGEDITRISPTLGFEIKTLTHGRFKLNIWDIGGQKTIRSFWRNYFEQTDGVVWVVDSADTQRLVDCKAELDKLLGEERLAGATLLIFANKQDLPGARSSKEISEILELDKINTRHWAIIQCSACEGSGLEQGVGWLVSDIASRIFMME
eukprot:GHVN01017647.1.p1 GENE.GHVN01017647.1~~GHVN01017647.1.p1  ORF type:complete len:185 (-),score=39.52 GHVN01017647.1:157-711(-)